MFPLLALAGWHRLKVPGLLLLAATVIAALHLKFVAAGHDLLGAEIPQMGLWRCLCGFTLGTVLCLVWQQWRECSGAAIVASAACGLLIAAGIAFDLPETALVPAVFFSGLLAWCLARACWCGCWEVGRCCILGRLAIRLILATICCGPFGRSLLLMNRSRLAGPAWAVFCSQSWARRLRCTAGLSDLRSAGLMRIRRAGQWHPEPSLRSDSPSRAATSPALP